MFPVDAQITALAPCPTALDTAMVIPRSLNEPVGFIPSNFRYTRSAPTSLARAGAETKGVPPSPREIIGVFLSTSSREKYSVITPRHWCAFLGLPNTVNPPLKRTSQNYKTNFHYKPSTRITEETDWTASLDFRALTTPANAASLARCVPISKLAVELSRPSTACSTVSIETL